MHSARFSSVYWYCEVEMTACDVVILGAGPYGLAAGAHLRNIQGLDVRVFGEPMEFWKAHMPEGMLLRSPWAASHISDPATALTMDAFGNELGVRIPTPIPLDRFVEYGLWFQRQAVPEIDRRRITRIERDSHRLPCNSQRWRAIAVAPGRNRRRNCVVCPPATAVRRTAIGTRHARL